MDKDIVSFIKKIINEKFESKPQGYDPKQVDQTLDDIVEVVSDFIDRWNALCDKYTEQKQNIVDLTNTIDNQVKEITILESKISKMEASGMSFAIINDRLNAVEKKQSPNSNTANNFENKK